MQLKLAHSEYRFESTQGLKLKKSFVKSISFIIKTRYLQYKTFQAFNPFEQMMIITLIDKKI